MPTIQAVRSGSPAFEPVTLAEAKKHLEIAASITAHDAHVTRLIQAAREAVESDTGMVVGQSTWVVKLDSWPKCGYIELPKRPVISVSSIAYRDVSDSLQTWPTNNYELDAGRVTPVIWPALDVDWPNVRHGRNVVTVTFVAGYANAAAVPELVKQAVLLLVGRDFNDREGQLESQETKAYERLTRRLMRSTYP